MEKNAEVDARVTENVIYDRLARLAIDTILMHIHKCAHLGHACFVEEGRHLLVILVSSGDHGLRNNSSDCPLVSTCMFTHVLTHVFAHTEKYMCAHPESSSSDIWPDVSAFTMCLCSLFAMGWGGHGEEKTVWGLRKLRTVHMKKPFLSICCVSVQPVSEV